MREQYIMQQTESSSGTGNPGHHSQRMAVWSGDTRAAGGMSYYLSLDNHHIGPVTENTENVT